MTDRDLTAPEAVERIANDCVWFPSVAATLRALSAALESERAENARLRDANAALRAANDLLLRAVTEE